VFSSHRLPLSAPVLEDAPVDPEWADNERLLGRSSMIIAVAGYALAALLFLLLAVYCIVGRGGQALRLLMAVACALTAVWATVNALWVYGVPFSGPQIYLAEISRDTGWLILLAGLIPREGAFSVGGLARVAAYGGAIVALAATPFLGSGPASGMTMIPLGLGAAIFGLVMVEQIFRNAETRQRWVYKFLLLGIGAVLAYDLFLYSHALLFRAIRADLWAVRGFANALVAPMLLIALRRSARYPLDLSVSRHVTFYTAALMGVGAYLLAMALAGYGIRLLGGTWGTALQALFLFGAVVLLAVILLSSRVRSEAKVFIAKHFYPSQYDYRDEWLRLTDTLASDRESLGIRVIRSLGNIVDAMSGTLWLRDPDRKGGDCFHKQAEWGARFGPETLGGGDALVEFVRKTQWSIHGYGYREAPDQYRGLRLPHWLEGESADWVAVPLLDPQGLIGLAVLNYPRAGLTMGYEEIDLLRIAGRQAASALAQEEANRKLADGRQFEAYNRLTAFIMHDLKNLIAQQSLVVRNAAKFKHDPEFIDDAIQTIGGSVRRMQRLLEQLSQGSARSYTEKALIAPIVERVVRAHCDRLPAPTLKIDAGYLRVAADPEQLGMVIGHVIRNAQDATPQDGRVNVNVREEAGQVLVEVSDTGSGMDPAFVRDRLFRPFDSTKGAKGMGIGAYQVRQFVEDCGGRVEVRSHAGNGTVFTLRIPSVGRDAEAMDAEKLSAKRTRSAESRVPGDENGTDAAAHDRPVTQGETTSGG
jgi:putative PEP-CTERM system histidine kinase